MPQWFFDIFGLIMLLSVAALILTAIFVISGARRFMRPPRYTAMIQIARSLPIDPSEMGLDFKSLRIEPDNEPSTATMRAEEAWIVPGQHNSRPAILYLHPWGSSKHEITHLLPYMIQHCSHVILMDIPGHGDSENPFTASLKDLTTYQKLIKETIDENGVVLMGRGLGLNIALNLASEPGVKGLIGDELTSASHPIRSWYHALSLPNLTPQVSLLLNLMGKDPEALSITKETWTQIQDSLPLLMDYTFTREPERLEALESFLKQFDTPPPGDTPS